MFSTYTFSLQCSPLFSFFQSFFSLSSVSSPAKDFPSHNSLSSFLSSPAPPAALPNGPRLSPNPSLSPCTQLFLTTAQSNAVFFCTLLTLVQGRFRANSPSGLHQSCSQMWLKKHIYPSAKWEWLLLDQGLRRGSSRAGEQICKSLQVLL